MLSSLDLIHDEGMTTATDTSISLSELLDRWRDRDGLSDATRKRERWQAGLVIAHFDGERPARSLSRAELAEWIGLVSESLASSSARVTIGFLPAEVGP